MRPSPRGPDPDRPTLITIVDQAEIPPAFRGGYLAIGNFDGVHRGHARLIARLRAAADLDEAPALALTFDPSPAALLRPEKAPTPLTWIERRAALLVEAGATEVGVFETGPWLLGLTAREFFDRILVGRFAARGLVEGPSFGFGRDRGGDSALLAAWCREAGLTFHSADVTDLDGRLVSSTRVRGALAEGDVAEASRLLGRPHRVRGVVESGKGRGRGLGFPTANLGGVDTQIPADGVYAGRVFLDGETVGRPAAVHVGANATFGETRRTVEVYIIDFDRDLYGSLVQADFIEHLRTSRKFGNVGELLRQIKEDIRGSRLALGV